MCKEELSSQVVLGVDPGTRITGYALLTKEKGSYRILDFGAIRPPVSLSLPERYLIIHEALLHLIEQFSPTAIAVESQFMAKNVQSTIKLAMARAAVLLAGAKKQVEVFEYFPSQAKMAIAGNGRAGKLQVQKMMQLLLNLGQLPEPEDAADALALALCHLHRRISV